MRVLLVEDDRELAGYVRNRRIRFGVRLIGC